jgi:hypothetical protein
MRNRASANRFYAIATGGVLIGLAALALTLWSFRPAALDPETLCPTSRPIAGHTVVIVDRTDAWSPAIGATLAEIIEIAQRNTAQYQRFSIVSLDADQSVRPLFSACNPGAPSLWSDLYRGRRYTQRDFEEKFVGAAESILAQVSEPSEASTSPIIEYLHRWLGADDFNADIPNRRLVLISDLRQHSPLYSVYTPREGDDLGAIVEDQLGPAAQGVRFDIYFIAHGRDGNVSEDQVRAVWDEAFVQLGATYEWRQIN